MRHPVTSDPFFVEIREILGLLEPNFFSSKALRCCKAFVSPPTSHARSVASRPGRAAAVARDVHRLVQDARAARAAWRERKSRYQFLDADFNDFLGSRYHRY